MSSTSLVRKEANDAIDALEMAMLSRYLEIKCPLNHSFGDQLYVREIFIPSGSKVTSKIHKKKHPFFVMKGKVKVWTDERGWQLIEAPYFGWTTPGTRRVLDVLEDVFWITCHANPDDTEDLEIIEQRIIETHDNPLIADEVRLHQ